MHRAKDQKQSPLGNLTGVRGKGAGSQGWGGNTLLLYLLLTYIVHRRLSLLFSDSGGNILLFKAALDVSEKFGPSNRPFLSCVRFVADEVTPAVFYLNDEWAKHEAIRSLNWRADGLSPAQRVILKQNDLLPSNTSRLDSPTLVYLIEGSWAIPPSEETGLRSGLVVPKREFILSSSEVVHGAYLKDSGLNAQTAILCLAAVGLEIMLPNVSFDLVADEEIERIKETLKEERQNYLDAISDLAAQSYERLKDGDFKEVLRWAEGEATFKLAPRARILEEATASLTGRQLRSAGYSF